MYQFILPVAFVGLVSLGGCATGYHSASNPILGITGGFKEVDGYGTLTKVSFHGNGYISVEKVTEYTLRRSAELAEQKGKPYFAIYRSIVEAHFNRPARNPNYFVVGNKPSGYAYVQFFDKEIAGAFETAETLKKYTALAEGAK